MADLIPINLSVMAEVYSKAMTAPYVLEVVNDYVRRGLTPYTISTNRMSLPDARAFIEEMKVDLKYLAVSFLKKQDSEDIIEVHNSDVCITYLTYSGRFDDFEDGWSSEEDCVLYVATANKDFFDKIHKKISVIETKIVSRCYAMINTGNELSLSPLELTDCDFIKSNYEEVVTTQRDRILNSFVSDEPVGRISILYGPPGGGKTRFIQSLLPREVKSDQKYIYLPAHLANELDTPALLGFLLARRKDQLIFIIEDCDALVTTRQMDNVNSLSTFLNFTDGILGSSMNLHFIVSTNAKKAEFDAAITRPGRLCELVEFNPLKVDRANGVLSRIAKERNLDPMDYIQFTKSASLAEVYARVNQATVYKDKSAGVMGFV